MSFNKNSQNIIIFYMLDISLYFIACRTHCIISGLDLLCCLIYILSSSFLIIGIKKARMEYYRKFNFLLCGICSLQTFKGALYFIIHEVEAENCIFDYVDYDGTIIICGIWVGAALIFMYYIRKVRINTAFI